MQCLYPVQIKNPLYRDDRVAQKKFLSVPCGRCIACRIARTREWSIRMMFENEMHEQSIFLTLTFDDEHLPPDLSIAKSDLQRFFHDLRQDIYPRKIRYYACGEYGEQFERPHYHAIVYGVGLSDIPTLEKCWKNGFIYTGEVTKDSCKYVAGYVQKKLYGRDAYVYEETGRVPPFSLMSKSLGKDFFVKHYNQLSKKITMNGFNVGMPKYYQKIIKDRDLSEFLDNGKTLEQFQDVISLKAFSSENSKLIEYYDMLADKGISLDDIGTIKLINSTAQREANLYADKARSQKL